MFKPQILREHHSNVDLNIHKLPDSLGFTQEIKLK